MSNALIGAFAALLLLSLLALLWSRWPAWLKGLLVLAVTALYFVGHDAVLSVWGLPSTAALPERFVVLAAVVEEPTTRTPGAIYLWVSEPREQRDQAALLPPRAYRLAYSKRLHGEVDEGIRKGKGGIAQMGTSEPRAGSGKALGWLKPGSDEQEIRIRDLPVPQLPEK